MDERTTRAGTPERRNYTPPGRLRRIFFENRGVTLALLGGVALLATLFVTATAWAVNERYERDVAKIAYAHDMRSLEFLAQQEQRSAAEIEGKARELEEKESELVPANRPYLVVSIAERKVSYIQGDDTLFAAPVAVGSGKTLVMGGTTKRFQTPRGRMSITHKELDPVWVPPNWHYVEVARKRGLRVVDMSNASPNALAGFPAGREPIRGGTIYIPPWGARSASTRACWVSPSWRCTTATTSTAPTTRRPSARRPATAASACAGTTSCGCTRTCPWGRRCTSTECETTERRLHLGVDVGAALVQSSVLRTPHCRYSRTFALRTLALPFHPNRASDTRPPASNSTPSCSSRMRCVTAPPECGPRALTAPWALITRCQGTVLLSDMAASA